MNQPWPEDLVAVAEILCPHGIRGEVKALPLTSSPDRFADLRAVTAVKTGLRKALTLANWRPWREFVMLTFAEVKEIGAAEPLRGARICVPMTERASLPAGRYYHDDLVGLKVRTTAGEDLGCIAEVMATGANDVFVVRKPDGGELLLPALASLVAEVDLADKVMLIEPMPGLLD